jgi:hypothetical protein
MSAATAAAVVTNPELQTEALSTVERANALTVTDHHTRELAAELGKTVAGLIDQALEWVRRGETTGSRKRGRTGMGRRTGFVTQRRAES